MSLREEEIRAQTCPEGQPCEDTGRRQPSTPHGERPQEESTPRPPWSQTPASRAAGSTFLSCKPLGLWCFVAAVFANWSGLRRGSFKIFFLHLYTMFLLYFYNLKNYKNVIGLPSLTISTQYSYTAHLHPLWRSNWQNYNIVQGCKAMSWYTFALRKESCHQGVPHTRPSPVILSSCVWPLSSTLLANFIYALECHQL